jgi:hypothetical protein
LLLNTSLNEKQVIGGNGDEPGRPSIVDIPVEHLRLPEAHCSKVGQDSSSVAQAYRMIVSVAAEIELSEAKRGYWEEEKQVTELVLELDSMPGLRRGE